MSVKRLAYFFPEDKKVKKKEIISDDPDETISRLANLFGMDDETIIATIVKENTEKTEWGTLDADGNES